MNREALEFPEREEFLQFLQEVGCGASGLSWEYYRATSQTKTAAWLVQKESFELRGYLKRYVDSNRAAQVMAKRAQLKNEATSFGLSVQLMSDSRTILYLFPYDGGLRELGLAVDLSKLKRILGRSPFFDGQRIRGRKSSLDIVRYKPEHRLLSKLTLGLVDTEGKKSSLKLFMRVFADNRGAEICRATEFLRQNGLAEVLPQQYGAFQSGRIQLEELRDGEEFCTFTRIEDAGELAQVVASMGSVRDPDLRIVSAQQLVDLRLNDLKIFEDASLDERIRRLSSAIGERLGWVHPEDFGVTHGDLHPKQFLVSSGQMTLIDFERCSMSHPALDAGHFAAEIHMRGLEQPVELRSSYASFSAMFQARWGEKFTKGIRRVLPIGIALGFAAGAARGLRRGLGADHPLSPARMLDAALESLSTLPIRNNDDWVWTCLYPSGKTPWAAFGRDGSSGTDGCGSFDPQSKRFCLVEPEADSALPGLVRALEEGELISRRVGRRAVVRVQAEEGTFYRKVLPPKKAKKAAQRLTLLNAALGEDQFLVPQLLGFDGEWGYLDVMEMPGESLHELVWHDREPNFFAAGMGLAKFQALDVQDDLPDSRDDDLQGWFERTLSFFPSEDRLLCEGFSSLPEAAGSRAGVLHGDFHDKNVILNGDRAGIIDVEGISRGPKARDVGNMLAHIELRSWQLGLSREVSDVWRQDFIKGYESGREALEEEEIEAERTRATFRLGCVYLFRKRWQGVARDLLRRVAPLIVLSMLFLTAGCVSLLPPPAIDLEDEVAGAEVELGVSYLRKKDTVEVEGEFRGDTFLAERIEIEEADDEIEVKSDLLEFDVESGEVRLGAYVMEIRDDSTFKTATGEKIVPGELPALLPSFCKAEGIQLEGRLFLRKLTLRERKPEERDELQGQIENLRYSRQYFEIAGNSVRFRSNTQVVWDVEGVDPPKPEDRGLRPRSNQRLQKILRIDDDDLRPGNGIRIAEGITLGGEFQWNLEWRRNHNLRAGRPRDRLIQEPSFKMEFSFEFSPQFFAFTKASVRRDWAIFDERVDDQHGSRISLDQAYFVALDFPFDGLALEIGRQKFDQGREWVFDDQIDGVRLFLNLDGALLEWSVSQKLFDEGQREDGITNYLFGAHLEPFIDSELFLYALQRSGGRLVDLDRLHVGASYQHRFGAFTMWGDFSYVTGSEDDLDVEGFGVDVMFMYVIGNSDLEPSIFGGFAWASGDNDSTDGKDSSFRQTGLQDNNDRFNGVTSFRFLGELVRPELSNLSVLTLGAGIRPYRKTSLDLVFHHYEQVEASKVIRRSRIRLDPLGENRTIGNEIDLIVGLSAWRPVEVEIVLGYFRPGAAFGPFQDPAWFFTFQAEWNF